MRTRMVTAVFVASVWLVGLGVLLGRGAAAAGRGGPARGNVPRIYGDGIPLAFSGLDGKTSSGSPCVAGIVGDGLAIKFHLPRNPVVRVFLPDDVSPRWEVVSNDLLVARARGDERPMVIGFVSANVMAGRLLPGARVSLEGGESSGVLLRTKIGDRVYFAFAYDPDGAAAAAAAASQGIRVSMETLVETRLDFFAGAPKGPEGIRTPRAMALAKAFSIMKVNTYAPEPPITVRWTTPSRWPHRYMRLAGSAFHSLGLMHLDMDLAKEALDAVYQCQGKDGFVPNQMGPGQRSEISHPPILGWAAWQIYTQDKRRDRAFLERSFDVSQKHTVWFMRNRRIDGDPPPEKPLEHGTPLYVWKSAEESGAENSPRFDGGADFAAIDLSCYLANECRSLQTMAQRLGYRELATTWGTRAEAIAAAARKVLWNDERGFFFDRKGPDGEWIDAWTYAGLLPIWSGVATDEQVARLKAHLVSEKFWGPAGVATVARDDTNFKKDMWRGPVWVHINYLILRGLQERGCTKEADDLRARTLAVVEKWYGKTGAFFEFYDPDDETTPSELGRKGGEGVTAPLPVAADYGPTAALYADLLLRPKP